jgi:hypothetical protein
LQLDPSAYVQICGANTQTGYENCATHHVFSVALWHIGKFLNDYSAATTALATIATAGFTLTLWRATDKLWKSSENTAKNQLRAFVFGKGFEPVLNIFDIGEVPRIHEYVFSVVWKNVGLTPATEAYAQIRTQIFPMNEDREPNFELRKEAAGVIGPQSEVRSVYITIPLVQMMQLWRYETEIFIWAKIEYRDVFNPATPHHHELCARIVPRREPDIIRRQNEAIPLDSIAYGPNSAA